MTIQQRLEAIRRIVKTETRVVVSELSRQFDVTEETIRRDLYKLETEGLVTRTYGGAILNQNITYENVDFRRREQTNPEQKRAIAALVSSVIPWNTTVSADGSSTVAEALKMLSAHEGLTVLTNSIKAIENLTDSKVRLVSTGGIVNTNTCSFGGMVTKKILENFNTEFALLSCKAINMDGGAYDSNEEEVELKKRMFGHAAKTILLVDSSKFDRIAFVHMLGLDQIYMLITDKRPSDKWCDLLKKKGVKLLYPDMEEDSLDDDSLDDDSPKSAAQ